MVPEKIDSTDDRLIHVLENFEAHLSTGQRSMLSVEKIVASVMLFLVTAVCLWVGTTLNELSQTVVELRTELKHTTSHLAEMKSELNSLRTGAGSMSSENLRNIGLIMERMKADDDQERRDADSISDIENRILALESKSPK